MLHYTKLSADAKERKSNLQFASLEFQFEKEQTITRPHEIIFRTVTKQSLQINFSGNKNEP